MTLSLKMLSSLRTVPPAPVVSTPSDDVVMEAEKALDLLLKRVYDDIPAGDHPLLRKIREAAGILQTRDREALIQTVALSMEINKSVASAVATMTQDMRRVDDHAETIAAASQEMVASVATISDNSQRAVVIVREAQGVAHEGIIAAQRAVTATETIVGAITEAMQRVDALARGLATNRRNRRPDRGHRQADQSTRPQRHHRGGASGGSRQGFCRGGHRSEKPRQPNGPRHRQHPQPHRNP